MSTIISLTFDLFQMCCEHDTVYLTCSQNLTGSQFIYCAESNSKFKRKTNKRMSMISPVQSSPMIREGSRWVTRSNTIGHVLQSPTSILSWYWVRRDSAQNLTASSYSSVLKFALQQLSAWSCYETNAVTNKHTYIQTQPKTTSHPISPRRGSRR